MPIKRSPVRSKSQMKRMEKQGALPDKLLGLTVHNDPTPHVKWADIKEKLTPKQWKDFCDFLVGQTCIAAGCYPWDFQRWIDGGMKNHQGADWD